MKNFSVGILFWILWIIPVNAAADDIWNPLMIRNLPDSFEGDTCADFSGLWTGSCISKGASNPRPSKLDIRRVSCKVLIINGILHPMGGSFDINYQSPKGALSPLSAQVLQGTYLPFWDKSETVIKIMSTATGHSLDADIPIKSFVTGESVMHLPDPKTLIEKMEIKGTLYKGDQALPINESRVCKYSRE